ncbi:12606_t:CDS:2 [Funneliformis geosporum]|nr:12606_t:CDS:2 [Funneliformis geosporum]
MAIFLILTIGSGIIYGIKKATDAYETNQKTKREKYDLKSKSLEAARTENKRLDERDKKIDELLESSKSKEKNFEKQISDIKKELNDPNISKEKEQELKNQLAFIQTQLDEERKNNKKLNEEKARNQKQREKNNETINKAECYNEEHRKATAILDSYNEVKKSNDEISLKKTIEYAEGLKEYHFEGILDLVEEEAELESLRKKLRELENNKNTYSDQENTTEIEFDRDKLKFDHTGELTVANYPNLERIITTGDGKLDLSNYPSLTKLNCYKNQLTELDLSSCSNLTELDCQKNNLTKLGISNCSNLTELNCGYNKMTNLTFVQNLTKLGILYITENNITTGLEYLPLTHPELMDDNLSLADLHLTEENTSPLAITATP